MRAVHAQRISRNGADRGPGRRIVSLQTSQALINAPQPEAWPKKSDGTPMTDQHGRIPYIHPALTGLPGLTGEAKDLVLDKARLAGLAERYGFDKVTRWKPKRVRCSASTLPPWQPEHSFVVRPLTRVDG